MVFTYICGGLPENFYAKKNTTCRNHVRIPGIPVKTMEKYLKLKRLIAPLTPKLVINLLEELDRFIPLGSYRSLKSQVGKWRDPGDRDYIKPLLNWARQKNAVPRDLTLSLIEELHEKEAEVFGILENLLEERKIIISSHYRDELTEVLKPSPGTNSQEIKPCPVFLNIEAEMLRVPEDSIPLFGKEHLKKPQEIHEAIKNYGIVVLTGMRGIGKTSILHKYLSVFLNEYSHIAYIAVTDGNVHNTVVYTLNHHLKAAQGNEQILAGHLPVDQLISHFKRQAYQAPLLVIDNANDACSLELFSRDWLRQLPEWKILASSFCSEFNPADIKARNIPLESLDEEDAIKLFLNYCEVRDNELDRLKRILKSIDYHPLLTELLSKLIRSSRRIGLKDIEGFNFFRSPARVLPLTGNPLIRKDLNYKGTGISDYMCRIFDDVFPLLSSEEKALLDKFRQLPPGQHPEEALLTEYSFLPEDIEYLDLLADKGWLETYVSDEGRCYYKMYELYRLTLASKFNRK